MLLQAIVFITGGAILALELLASRIMTPYFGVSLYIWTGILSITLISLALGYWLGGRIASGSGGHPKSADKLVRLFALMPALAAFAVVAACLLYPYLFHELARRDLVVGAFVACMLLLFVPLLTTSAMNPLLVALLLQRRSSSAILADAGAGRVFFVSTLGSVAGVLVTAFGLIPYLGNFAATLVVAAVLALLPLIVLAGGMIPTTARRPLALTAGVALIAALGLLAGADAYTGRMWPASYGGQAWTHEASYRSLFGTVKILKSEPQDGRFLRIYFQDGLIQNMVTSDNRSMSLYTYALEALSYAYRPQLRSALVLGIGAGMVPMRLAQQGVEVETVDIDPASLRAASGVFGLDFTKVRAHQADARTFLRKCTPGYDVVIVDLFHGDGVPDYLVTRDVFRDLKRCLGNDGIAVFNTFADLDRPRPYAHFLTTLRAELPFVVIYRPDYGLASHINSFVVASNRPLPAPTGVNLQHVPQRHLATLAKMLREPRPLDQQLLEHGRVITDAINAMPADFAASQMVNRRYVLESLPPAFFVN